MTVEVEWGNVSSPDIGEVRDAKLWPGGGREWDWTETGTHHVPGIQIDDVEELVENGAEIVILSEGMHFALQTSEDTLSYLEENNVEWAQLETNAAVELYNELVAEGKKVGALIHSTC